MNSVTKNMHIPVHMLDFAYNFQGLWAPKSIRVFQVKPSVMVNPLLIGISFYKIKCLLNSHGSGKKNKLEQVMFHIICERSIPVSL